jgi:hypothetical protein
MKNLLNKTSSLLILLVLGGLITLFAFSLKQGTFLQSVAGQTQPGGYPGPRTNSDVPLQDPYPAPVTLNESVNQDSCSGLGKWELYTDKIAGYSLRYPAESELRESPIADENYRSVSIYLKPSCYGQQCWGSNRVIISMMKNPERLPVSQFVEQEFKLQTEPPHVDSLQNFQTSKSIIDVAGTQGLRIENGITFDKPDIYIPHGDRIIRVAISADSPLPPHDPPCKQTLEMLDGILNSIELLPSTTK